MRSLSHLIGILFFSVLFLFQLIPAKAVAATGDWPTYLHDNYRQSANLDETSISASSAPSLNFAWTFKTNGIIASSATIVNNIVYVGSWDGYEYALNATNGSQIWKTFLGTSTDTNCNPPTLGVTSSATVQNGIVYVGGGDSNWYALDASTGAVLWKIFTGDNSTTGGHYNWASPLIYNGFAYIGIASNCDLPLVQGQLIQVNLTTHAVVNTFNVVNANQVGGGIWTSPAIDPTSNTIYVSTGTISGNEPYAQAILAIDATTMQLKDSWQLPAAQALGDADFGTTPIVFPTSSNQTFVSAINKNGIIYALNTKSLAAGPVWQRTVSVGGACPQCGEGSISSGAFAEGKVFAAAGLTTIGGKNFNGSINAFDPATGNLLWQTGLPQSPLAAIAYANGVVVVGAGSQIQAFAASNGTRLISIPLDSIIYGAPSVSNGTLYTGTINGTLYALKILPGAPQPNQRIGGMNLSSYCGSLGQSTNLTLTNGQWYCGNSSTPINMTNACLWEYTDANEVAKQDVAGNPYTWSCYQTAVSSTPTPTPTSIPTATPTLIFTPTPTPGTRVLGGLNLNGYCASKNQGSAVLINGNWNCNSPTTTINMTSACQWQYSSSSNVTAIQSVAGNPYSWVCVSNSVAPTSSPTPTQAVATPTPTRSATPTPTRSLTPTPTPGFTTRLGGLNLNGYCATLGFAAQANLTNGTWYCSGSTTAINLTNACMWQYNLTAVIAKQDRTNDPYSWSCYK